MFTELQTGPFYGFWRTSEGNSVIKGKKLGGVEFYSNHKEYVDCFWAMPVLELIQSVLKV